MSKKSIAQPGRTAYDERGQPVWEWRVDTGIFTRDVDTRQMRKIKEADVSLEGVPPEQARRFVGFDPYSTAVAKAPPAPAPKQEPPKPKTRRTLDDMRALSDEIKKNRLKKQPDGV